MTRMMCRFAIPVALVFAVAACGDLPPSTSPAAPSYADFNRGGAPTPWPFPPAENTFLSNLCGFPVFEEFSGKLKFIELPGDRTIDFAPALTVTWTNLATGKKVTRSTAGSIHVRPLPNGNTEVVLVGHNPVGIEFEGQVYFVFLSGRMTLLLGPDGFLLKAPEVTGSGADVCALLA